MNFTIPALGPHCNKSLLLISAHNYSLIIEIEGFCISCVLCVSFIGNFTVSYKHESNICKKSIYTTEPSNLRIWCGQIKIAC